MRRDDVERGEGCAVSMMGGGSKIEDVWGRRKRRLREKKDTKG